MDEWMAELVNTDTRTLYERLWDKGFRADEIATIETEVKDWLVSYVDVGLDPTEPVAELEDK